MARVKQNYCITHGTLQYYSWHEFSRTRVLHVVCVVQGRAVPAEGLPEVCLTGGLRVHLPQEAVLEALLGQGDIARGQGHSTW